MNNNTNENTNQCTGRFRKKRVYYTSISNEALRDEKLSLKAKGLYALIQSYLNIENFVLYKKYLKTLSKDGEKSFESAWKELVKSGYLVQYKYRGEKGHYFYEYELLDYIHAPQDVESNSTLICFNESFNRNATSKEIKEIERYKQLIDEDIIIRAFGIASFNQKGFAYACGILNNWISSGVKTFDDYIDMLKNMKG